MYTDVWVSFLQLTITIKNVFSFLNSWPGFVRIYEARISFQATTRTFFVIHRAETLGSNWSSGFVFLSVEANGDAAKAFNFEEPKEYLKPSEEGKKLASEVREPRYKNIVHLWEFLLELLAEDNCRPLITWISKERGEFKLKNPEEVAKRWGILKRKKGMNYEKLGRALRYYYQQGIIKKVGPYSSFMLI